MAVMYSELCSGMKNGILGRKGGTQMWRFSNTPESEWKLGFTDP